MIEPAFLAVDWGTTNRRVYAISAEGEVAAVQKDDRGVLAISPGGFAAEVDGIRASFGNLTLLCAGMVGSARGWIEVPYAACPANLAELAANLTWVEKENTAIVPGVSTSSDVMRGEEVQMLGAVISGAAPADALLCQPGTHCKWARMAGGAIVDFRTAMTGEVFALLQRHSLLADFLQGPVTDNRDFHDGLKLAEARTPLTSLFAQRAGVLLGHVPREAVAARVSGLLIGTDVAEQNLLPGETVHILADPRLGPLYAAAVRSIGAVPVLIDSQSAFVAGITAVWSLSHGS